MKYDDASWHFNGDFPEGSPERNGGTHIALFMKWCFIMGWAGEIHTEYQTDETKRVISNELSATAFFFEYCDGKLTGEDLNQKGNEFAERYYGEDGLYLDDYVSLFGDLMYVESEARHDFFELTSKINARLESDILTKSELYKSKPWWKFW